MKNEKNYMGFSYYKNIANFKAFWWDKTFSKNLLFLGSAKVIYILYSTGDNEISRLGEGTFVEVANLQELHLNKNRFMSLEQDALEDLKDLERLDLSQNQLEDVNGLFSHSQSLIW